MKKACIITMYGNYNLGNKLQNYAVQEILKKYELDAETLIHNNYAKNKLTKRIYNKLKSLIKNIKKYFFRETLETNESEYQKKS